MVWINHYSFLLAAVVCVGALAIFVIRRGIRRNDLTALGALALGFVVAFLLLRPVSSGLGEADQVRARIGAGAPVLLELQSPYCLGCMAARPVVDRIERAHAERLDVLRVDIQDPAGRELAAEFASQFTPTFIFFDGDGLEQWRTVGAVDPLAVSQSLAQP
jgi:thiol-disulfide isomerase/thioredoxin